MFDGSQKVLGRIDVIALIYFLLPAVLHIYGCSAEDKSGHESLRQFLLNAVDVQVYDIEAISSSYSLDINLDDITKAELDIYVFKRIIDASVYVDGFPIWKGSSLATVELSDHSVKHIAFSYYGSFYKILDCPGYYRIDDTVVKQEWNHIYRESIIRDKFIPARLKNTKTP